MKDRKRNDAIVWNLMLLLGRPLAFVGITQIVIALMGPMTSRDDSMGIGALLIGVGFVFGWTGKIAKALYCD